MPIQIELELDYLKSIILEMFELVRKQINMAKMALINHDQEAVEEIIRNESRVNGFEITIEKECENLLALHQPVATDLRFIMAALITNGNIERIGDHADKIAKIVRDNENPFDNELIQSLHLNEAFEIVDEMMEKVITAFATRNDDEARLVFKLDKSIDKINKKSLVFLNDYLKDHSDKIIQALWLFRVIGKLERVGDVLKNVAEEVIFYLDAEILKHKKLKYKLTGKNNP